MNESPYTTYGIALRTTLLVALLTGIALVYMPGTTGGYVFDDMHNIVDNAALEMSEFTSDEFARAAYSSDAGRLNRPIAMGTFALERYFFGLDPFPMKITNVVIHLINTLLVFALALLVARRLEQRLTDRHGHGLSLVIPLPMFALAVAAAWALAPINLTGVLYVVQRMEALATLFMLAGLIVYILGRLRIERGRLRSGWALVLGGLGLGTALAVLSKESGVMLPVFALLAEWLLFGFGAAGTATRRGLYWLFGLVLVLPGVAGLATVLPNNPEFPHRPFDLWERLWTQAHAMWFYMRNIVAPDPGALTLYHDAFPLARGWNEPWTSLPAALGLLGLVAGAFALWRRYPLITFGVLFFFIPHLLVSTIIGLELVYEHRNHMASAGLIMAVFGVLLSGRPGDSLAFARKAAVIGLIVLYGFLTFLRANEWSDPIQLAYFEATRQGDSPRAAYELGQMLIVSGAEPGDPSYSLAIQQFERASQLQPPGLLPYQALIYEHARHGLDVNESWWEAMRQHIREKPLAAQDQGSLRGLVRAKVRGGIEIDVQELGQTLRLAYKNHSGRRTVSFIYGEYLSNVEEDLATEESVFLQYTLERPDDPAGWVQLARTQLGLGKHQNARASLERAAATDRHSRHDPLIRSLRKQASTRVVEPIDG
ncbi:MULTISPECIES: tetratricopeptide repeat protein [unclassified Thioalkalivibrio]|uniref:tetratricopeptide repeat protein n=1 Tax=unclassified Thioalkalivibrio TaxID=2621013 RepID=UPI001E5D0FC4|nr:MULTISPECIES: tetratricopeptide repeat protein [unclassified Thioalkalivibrio]